MVRFMLPRGGAFTAAVSVGLIVSDVAPRVTILSLLRAVSSTLADRSRV